ncbi:MAG: hypothetical protein GEV09_23260 [Pseudonocardiaceae bacterium]|nr:hypothetical protein [Pseudonocardiaceae bacterium]
MRRAAELLADLDDPEPAAALLAAADRDPLAPPVLGADRARYDRLWQRVTGDATRPTPRPPAGRAEAVAHALAALDRHR